MPEQRLHLDADTSRKSLMRALQQRGYDVTRTPNEWMPADATDIQQLLGTSAQGRCLVTFNARDFIPLAQEYPHQGGIILSRQQPMPALLCALLELLREMEGHPLQGQVRWLRFL
jgi:hypothetical protein